MTSGISARPRRMGLPVRLLAAQLLVLVIAAVTAWLVAAAVGPSIFHNHLGQVSHAGSPGQATDHAEQAFRDASFISWSVALVAAFVSAFAVSAFVTRRISRPVASLANAASKVASGHFDVAVPDPALGAEFDTLTQSFTEMAARLHSVETTRRRLLADLAHEMRNPVATLDGYLEGFEDGVATLNPETAVMLRTQTRRLARLAEDITAVSRAEEHQLNLHLNVTTAQRLVDGALGAAVDGYADKDVTLTGDLPLHLPEVRVDPERLAQVLGNLLDNALRHTARGGAVTLSAAAADGYVTLQVADTGTGIPPEHLPHVFERFYRVDTARDRDHGGSGIGLAIAKALVEAHGGRITATSSGPGAGAAFTVHLPSIQSHGPERPFATGTLLRR